MQCILHFQLHHLQELLEFSKLITSLIYLLQVKPPFLHLSQIAFNDVFHVIHPLHKQEIRCSSQSWILCIQKLIQQHRPLSQYFLIISVKKMYAIDFLTLNMHCLPSLQNLLFWQQKFEFNPVESFEKCQRFTVLRLLVIVNPQSLSSTVLG